MPGTNVRESAIVGKPFGMRMVRSEIILKTFVNLVQDWLRIEFGESLNA